MNKQAEVTYAWMISLACVASHSAYQWFLSKHIRLHKAASINRSPPSWSVLRWATTIAHPGQCDCSSHLSASSSPQHSLFHTARLKGMSITVEWLSIPKFDRSGKDVRLESGLLSLGFAVINMGTVSNPRRFISAHSSTLQVIILGSQGWKQQATGRSHGGCCCLGCSSWLARPAVLQYSRSPVQGWPHSRELCSPTSIFSWEDPPHANLARAFFFSAEVPSSKMTLTFVKLTYKL